MENIKEYFELIFAEKPKNPEINLQYKILEDVVSKLNWNLAYFFNLPELKSLNYDFSKDSISEKGYKNAIYGAYKKEIAELVYHLIPNNISIHNVDTIMVFYDRINILYKDSNEIEYGYNYKIIDNLFWDSIMIKTLWFIEELANVKESIKNLKNVPDVREHLLIKHARKLFEEYGTRKHKKDRPSINSQREALILANQSLGFPFEVISIEEIKNKRKENLEYLVSKDFTKKMIEKWKDRFNTEIDYKILSGRKRTGV